MARGLVTVRAQAYVQTLASAEARSQPRYVVYKGCWGRACGLVVLRGCYAAAGVGHLGPRRLLTQSHSTFGRAHKRRIIRQSCTRSLCAGAGQSLAQPIDLSSDAGNLD